MTKKIFSAVALCALLFSTHADITMQEKQTTITKGKKGEETESETATIWVTADKLRRDTPKQSTVIRLDKDMAILIDHEKKSYQEVPFSAISSAASQTQDMSGLPPMLQNMMKMNVKIEPTTETKTIGSWHCTKYNQTLEIAGGTTISEMWASEDIKVNTELFQKFHTALFLHTGMKQIAGNLLEEIKKVKGYVVYSKSTTKIMGTESVTTSELTEIKEANAPEGTYEIPAKYKKKKFE